MNDNMMSKKIFAMILTAVFVFTSVFNTGTVFAGTVNDKTKDSISMYMEQSNPLYPGGNDEPIVEVIDAVPFSISEEASPNTASTVEYAATVEEAASQLRAEMVEREANPVISVKVDELTEEAVSAAVDDIFTAAMKHTGNPEEGDALKWVYEKCACQISGSYDGTDYYIVINYDITYYTTAEQEAALTTAVENLKTELELEGKSDYEKVKAIYDYMTANIEYDYANLKDDTHTLKYTAYAALVNKTSVCQGYAVLMYRMALEYGIDIRVIAGTSTNNQGNAESHAWNIVKLGDKYYNLDATWDSTWDSDKAAHDFFLQGSDNFANHTCDEDFTTETFVAAYPIDTADYVPGAGTGSGDEGTKEPEIPVEPEEPEVCTHEETEVMPAVAPNCTDTGLTEGLKCASCGEVLTAQEEVAAAGHAYDDGVITKEATTTETGVKTYTCGVCGDAKAEETPMLHPVTYSYDSNTKTLTFSGEGVIEGAENCAENPWYIYADKAETLVLEEGITGLGNFVFKDFVKLQKIDFPEEMYSLGQQAFNNCDSLVEIELPDGISFFDSAPFGSCDQLEKVTFGEFEGGGYVFAQVNPFLLCPNLKTIIVPENNNMFYEEDGLLFSKGYDGLFCYPAALDFESYCLGDNVKEIYDYAFSTCSNLKSVDLPQTITLIGAYIFEQCSELEQIIFNCDKAEMRSVLHTGCKNLKTITNNTEKPILLGERELSQDDAGGHFLKNGITHWRDSNTKIYVETIGNGTAESVVLWYGMEGQEFVDDDGNHNVILAMKDITCDLLNSKDKIVGAVRISTCKARESLPEYVEQSGFKYEILEYNQLDHNYFLNEEDGLLICSGCGDVFAESAKPEKEHEYIVKETAPTCTEDGYTTYTCEICGDSYTSDIVEATGHSYDDGVVTKAPTATTAGVKTFTCQTCKATKTTSIPATGTSECKHENVITLKATEATCTKTGLTEGKVCAYCGEVIIAQEIVAATGHAYDNGVVTKSPTATAAGEMTFTCQSCGAAKTTVIPATGTTACTHVNINTIEAIEATCTEDGYTEGKQCASCGKVLVAQELIPAFGHSEEAVPGKEESCTEDGLTEGLKCAVCGEILEEQEAIPATGHDGAVLEGEDPTCTESGLTEGVQCQNCEKIMTAQKEIPALGHDWDEWYFDGEGSCEGDVQYSRYCNECGEEEYKTEKGPGHEWGEWEEEDSSCEGTTFLRMCENCGEEESKYEKGNGHSYKKFTKVITRATTKAAGKMGTYQYCEECQDKEDAKCISTTTIKKIAPVKMSATGMAYTGKSRIPTLTVKDAAGNKLKKGTDYKVTIKNSKGKVVTAPKAVGKYKITISFIGKYKGFGYKNYNINPKGLVLGKLTAGKKQITVKWKKQKLITGYQIRYSTKQNMNGAKMVTVANVKTTTKTIKQLKAKKKYWVQIRTYKTVNGQKHFSAWSAKKTITTK